jgi:hypothetical protein
MDVIQLQNFQLYMLAGMFILGMLTFATGVIILIMGAWGRDLRNTISQTHRLAQKGLADELSGLVGNASSLLTAVNDLMKTRNGIGVTLIITGVILMVVPSLFILVQYKKGL